MHCCNNKFSEKSAIASEKSTSPATIAQFDQWLPAETAAAVLPIFLPQLASSSAAAHALVPDQAQHLDDKLTHCWHSIVVTMQLFMRR